MQKIAKALATLGLVSGVHASAETLNEIYQQAVANDHLYKAAEAAMRAGEENKRAGRSGLLPQINGEVTWSDSDFDQSGESFDESTLQLEPVEANPETTSSGYSISLIQPLFNMAAWHSYKQGKIDSKIALAEFQSAKQDLIIRTAESYFNVLQAMDNFETAKAEQNANSHQLEQTQKRFEVGLTAITDVHEAQAAYDNSLARRLLQEGNVGISFEALEVITGKSYQNLAALKEDFPIAPPSPLERKAWETFSIENNFNLAAASLAAESARQTANQAKAGHYPTLTGSLSYSDTNTEVNQGSTLISDLDEDGYAVGLTLSVPLFSGGSVSASRRQAAEGYIQARESYFQTQRDIIQSARSLHLTVLTDVATIKARKQAIVSSNSALEATQAGYEVGTRDLVDVLIAQRTLYTAQSDYSDALYTYILNTLRLKQVAGILTEKDILELDRWLDTNRQKSRVTE